MQAQSPAAAEVVEEVGLSLLTSSLDSTPRPQPVHDEQPDTSNAHRHSVVVEAEEPAHDSHLAAPAAELAPAPPAKPRSSGRSATRHRRAPNSATRAAPHEKMHGHALQEASSAGSGTQGAVPQQQRPTRHGSPVTSPIAVRAPSTHAESVREGGSDAGQEVLVIDPEAAPAPHKKEGDTKAKQPHAKESSVRSASPSHPSRDLREAKAPHPHKHATKRSPPKHSGHKRRRMPRFGCGCCFAFGCWALTRFANMSPVPTTEQNSNRHCRTSTVALWMWHHHTSPTTQWPGLVFQLWDAPSSSLRSRHQQKHVRQYRTAILSRHPFGLAKVLPLLGFVDALARVA